MVTFSVLQMFADYEETPCSTLMSAEKPRSIGAMDRRRRRGIVPAKRVKLGGEGDESKVGENQIVGRAVRSKLILLGTGLRSAWRMAIHKSDAARRHELRLRSKSRGNEAPERRA